MTTKLDQIARVLEAVETRELAKLANLSARATVFQESLIALRNAKATSNQCFRTSADPTVWQNCDNRNRWIDGHINSENLNLAKLSAEIETQKQKTGAAIGKKSAFAKLAEKAAVRAETKAV